MRAGAARGAGNCQNTIIPELWPGAMLFPSAGITLYDGEKSTRVLGYPQTLLMCSVYINPSISF